MMIRNPNFLNNNYLHWLNPRFIKYRDERWMLLVEVDINDPRKAIYFILNEKYLNNDTHALYDGITKIRKDIDDPIKTYENLGDNFGGEYEIGWDWLISHTLYNYAMHGDSSDDSHDPTPYLDYTPDRVIDIQIPDFLDRQYTPNYEDFYDVSDITIKDLDNMQYFINWNTLYELEYTVDELKALPSTFFTKILEMGEPTDPSSVDHAIWTAVMKYFAGGGSDCATILMKLILNDEASDADCSCNQYNYLINNSKCGCAKTTDTSDNTCLDSYIEKMKELLQKMLGDIRYYCDWFYVLDGEGSSFPNEPLIQALIELLEEFKKLGYVMSQRDDHGCDCGKLWKEFQNSKEVNDIIDHYIQVLDWIKQGKMVPNKNKIYLYGKEFANLLIDML